MDVRATMGDLRMYHGARQLPRQPAPQSLAALPSGWGVKLPFLHSQPFA